MDRETWRLTVDGSWSRMNPRGGVVGRAGWTARLRMLDDFFAMLPSRNTSSRRPFTRGGTPRGSNVCRASLKRCARWERSHQYPRRGGDRPNTSARAHLAAQDGERRSAKGSSPSSPADWADVPTARIHAALRAIDRKPPRQSPHSSPTSRASALVCSCARDHRFDASILWNGAITLCRFDW